MDVSVSGIKITLSYSGASGGTVDYSIQNGNELYLTSGTGVGIGMAYADTLGTPLYKGGS
jgi:hypothetical protein